MFPGDRVTLLEWHWVKEGDWEKKKSLYLEKVAV